MVIECAQAALPDAVEAEVTAEGNFLSQEQRQRFHEEGYLILPDWWSKEECEEIRTQVQGIVEDLDLNEARTIFSTDENHSRHAKDEYFLGSSDKIRFFWEPEAINEKGEFVQDKLKCINKIGHALHDLDPVLKKYSYETRVGQVARELGIKVPLAVQSMYIFKQPRIGGEVSPHQDGTFLYTEPLSVLGFWWALEDCTLDNGCLYAVPGSHNLGVHRRFKRTSTGEGCEFDPPGKEEFEIEAAVPLEVKAGTLALLHHSLVHYSGANKSDKSRHAYSIHVVEGTDGFEYLKDNWLQRPIEAPFQQLP